MTGPALEEAPEAPLPRALTEREERFVDEYDLIPNASQAALKAGYSEHSAGPLGYQLLQRPVVQAALAQRKAKRKADLAARGEKLAIDGDKLLQDLQDIAEADPNELILHMRRCCRFCWGVGNRRQHTPEEQRERRAAWDEAAGKQNPRVADDPLDDVEILDGRGFDEEGGIYDGKREPNPDCPECFGDGISVAFMTDTRLLSPADRKLYAGTRKTKDGFEVKVHDQVAARLSTWASTWASSWTRPRSSTRATSPSSSRMGR